MQRQDINRIAADAARDAKNHAAGVLDAGRRPADNLAAIAANILTGYHIGDPEIMDYCPSPLSGEWAGEDMFAVLDLPTDTDPDTLAEAADTYEEHYFPAWWDALLTECAGHILAHLTPDTPGDMHRITRRGYEITRAPHRDEIYLRDTNTGEIITHSTN